MATLMVRGISEETKRRLRIQAAHHDRSMEAEARAILEAAITPQSQDNWFTAARAALDAAGEYLEDEFDDLRLPSQPRPVDFGEEPA